jgi:hypothetical protein
MIVTEFYNGQGLGNQIWGYAALRGLAARHNYSFGVQSPERFKGNGIFEIDFGVNVIGGTGNEGGPPIKLPESINHYIKEAQLFEKVTNLDVTSADPNLLCLADHTKFDGNCQSLKYLHGIEHLIPHWLKLKPLAEPDFNFDPDVCVLHVRGGDFLNTYSYLPQSYYKNAMNLVEKVSPGIQFVAVTDDLKYCKKILPRIPIVGSTPHNRVDSFRAAHHKGGSIDEDFSILNRAKFVILSSSTFSFWAAYLNLNKPFVVAPKYWFAFSKSDGWWSTADCVVPSWKYLDCFGMVTDGDQCIQESKSPISSPVGQNHIIRSFLFRIERRVARLKIVT